MYSDKEFQDFKKFIESLSKEQVIKILEQDDTLIDDLHFTDTTFGEFIEEHTATKLKNIISESYIYYLPKDLLEIKSEIEELLQIGLTKQQGVMINDNI